MNDERNIIDRVLSAQNHNEEIDSLIRDYFPFIKKETAKVTGKIPIEGRDEELSIALMGFHEAIENYEQSKGSFLNFASVVIRRRIIDYLRSENKRDTETSLETVSEENKYKEIKGTLADEVEEGTAIRWEIQHLTKDLNQLGITISDVAKACPKTEKAIGICRQIILYLISHPECMEEIISSGKIPAKLLIKELSVKRKLLEKYRKYLVALAVIYFREYECIINHLSGVFNSEKGGK